MASLRLRKPVYVPIDPQVRAHFEPYPWATALLSTPTLTPFQTPTRTASLADTHTLIGQTLNTQSTLAAWQPLYRAPDSEHPSGETLLLVKLGPGLDGHKGLLHGGMVSCLLDEVMGHAAYMSHDEMAFTANMRVEFRAPVRTPGVVLLRAFLEERSKGRKMYVKAVLEDGEGRLAAEGECLYLSGKKKSVL